MHNVFISYSSIDQLQAETVRGVLEKNGIPCWMAPRDIPGGSNYTKEIPVAIRGCQVFVLILSENAQNSHWVLKELDSAVNLGKVILPFMLEDCQLNDEFNFLLTGAQRYSAYQKKAEAMETLISRIRAITDAERPAEPVTMPKPQEIPTQSKAAWTGFGKCPACGGTELEELTKRVGKFGGKEWLISLLVPLFAVLFLLAVFVLLLVLWGTIYNYENEGLMSAITAILLIGGPIAGVFVGRRVAGEQIRRQRIRHQMRPNPYRCTACRKEFLIEKD
jgi:hypothetical protein